MKKNKYYRRLLSAAAGFKNRFALVLVTSTHFDVQRQWRKQLTADLKKENIRLVHIRGDSWKDDSRESITAFIQKHIPASGRWVLSLSHFDYHMMPQFPDHLKDKALISEEYQVIPTPSSFLQRLNVEREAIVNACPGPVIFWTSKASVRQMAEHAPDFYDFRQFIIELTEPEHFKHLAHVPETSFIKTRKPGVLSGLVAPMDMPYEQAREKEQEAFSYESANQKEKALEAWEETIVLYRKLAQADAVLYLPALVSALNRKGVLLAELDQPLRAEKIFREAIELSRELYEKEPGVHSPILAAILNNFALLLTKLKKLTEAEIYYKEAIKLYRALPDREHRIFLAQVLNNYGGLMASMNRLDDALPLHQEALHLRRLYFNFTTNFHRHSADLCQSLYNLSFLLEKMGHEEEAKMLYEEAAAANSLLGKPRESLQADTSAQNKKVSGNPYKWRGMLPANSDMFFGRTREMEHIMDILSSKQPQSVSMVGERRIGKSSLAFRLYRQIKEKQDTLAIYLDCDSLPKECESDNDFYRLLNDAFQQELDRDTGMKERAGITREELFTGYREFRRFVDGVSQKGLRVVIFLDEFEHLPDQGFADNRFFSNLRAIANTPDFSLAFVIISETGLKELTHWAIQSSSFYNIFETVFIGLMDPGSIAKLRDKGFQEEKFKLSGEEKKKIGYYAGDFAFFNQVVCAFLWNAKHHEETPDWDDLEVKLVPYYDKLWKGRSRREQVLLKKLKKYNKNIDFDLKALKVRGLLTREGNRYYPFSDFFGHLIEKRFEVGKKDIFEKGILKKTKEVLKVLSDSKYLITGNGD